MITPVPRIQERAAAESEALLAAADAARLETEELRRRAESAETRGLGGVLLGKMGWGRGAAARAAAMGESMRAEVASVGVGACSLAARAAAILETAKAEAVRLGVGVGLGLGLG